MSKFTLVLWKSVSYAKTVVPTFFHFKKKKKLSESSQHCKKVRGSREFAECQKRGRFQFCVLWLHVPYTTRWNSPFISKQIKLADPSFFPFSNQISQAYRSTLSGAFFLGEILSNYCFPEWQREGKQGDCREQDWITVALLSELRDD